MIILIIMIIIIIIMIIMIVYIIGIILMITIIVIERRNALRSTRYRRLKTHSFYMSPCPEVFSPKSPR